jgi:hypothetical protein
MSPIAPRRLLAPVAAAITLLAWGILAATAVAAGLDGNFKVHFPKGHPASNAPCPEDVFCGVGRLAGYGEATITIDDESFEEIPDSPCLNVTWVQSIHPTSDVGNLVLGETGTFCPPGGSGDSNAGPSSYGHPGTFRMHYTIDGVESAGAFAGASGEGSVRFESAGGVGVWRVAGDLVLGG